MSNGQKTTPLVDQEARDQILTELEKNMLVEAAAGTGKTTSMMGRMVALLKNGRCKVGSIAAVTFTRKAAAELRSRFQIRLEQELRRSEGKERDNLEEALKHVEQCFIGTIHSFCGRLLRERPVEAHVDLAFEEIEPDEDERLRREAWSGFCARLTTDDPEDWLGELQRLGLNLSDLEDAFVAFCNYPDVEEWPAPPPKGELPDITGIRRSALDYVDHILVLLPTLPDDAGTDKLMPIYKRIARTAGHVNLDDPVQLMALLDEFRLKGDVTQKMWPGKKPQAMEELKRYDDFKETIAGPAMKRWREVRYGSALPILTLARAEYDKLRQDRGKLNFQDLLMKAAGLLKGNPNVRSYFRKRLTHLMVDEFQDTDPIQAEVMMLLTATEPNEDNWRRCIPAPGSLFVVGDPKQSIYRFRRADIVTYNEVKRIITGNDGGMCVQLSANFRSTPRIINWVNETFSPAFPAKATDESPEYVSLGVGKADLIGGSLDGVYRLTQTEKKQKDDRLDEEAERIARIIRNALDEGLTVACSEKDARGVADDSDGDAQSPLTHRNLPATGQARSPFSPGRRCRLAWRDAVACDTTDEGPRCASAPDIARDGGGRRINPGDFLILSPVHFPLSLYASKLQKYGIPHRVTGGSALNELAELRLLYKCVGTVANPDNPVFLVGALRSELFGVSDAQLYAFKKAKGRFDYREPVPDKLDDATRQSIGYAFDKLSRYSKWLDSMPAVSAVERIASDSGLMVLAGHRPGGEVDAGSLSKVFELLRESRDDMWTVAQMVEYLGQLIEKEEEYDAVSALSEDKPCVRVMNLHKAKGLEAPVVFLGNPLYQWNTDATTHIDRSGDRVCGYMLIQKKSASRFGGATLLAQPEGWDELAEKESAFLSAEMTRLQYVAATRAGSALVIARPSKSPKDSTADDPWRDNQPDGEIKAPDEASAPQAEEQALTSAEVREALGEIESKSAKAGKPTFLEGAAKEHALAAGRDGGAQASAGGGAGGCAVPILNPEGEHGMERGSVIHALLEAAMRNPGDDLVRLAESSCREHGLEVESAQGLAEMARVVAGSETLRRARASLKWMVEVPFETMIEELTPEEGPVCRHMRGGIDLVFREADGWVIVDYKTDRGRTPDELVSQYAPQVRLYARAWEKMTGQRVKEIGLLSTETMSLINVPLDR
ncbi:MAG TPA: UvrD-helicase domain-containing protein [Candidatus Brocadiia bacterium]|nr:UvrD-helicase domain-containing protein [Candidatus Brocadiia bacterium]